MTKPLNVIYVVSHDTGRFLGCYGRPIPVTPNLDRFARENVRFANAFCSAPACGPSRCCAMTGKYSHVTGTLGLGGSGWDLPDAEQTLVDDFNAAGYTTVHMGFCHERRYGEMRYKVDSQRNVDGERYWKDNAHLVVDNALAWLKGRDRATPFYMNLATGQTHTSRIRDDFYGPPLPPEQCWIPPFYPDQPLVREYYGLWYAELRYFDQQIGRLLAGIESLGLADDTLVVLTTDHGVSGPRATAFVNEAGVEIFLLARLPGGARRSVVDHLIPNIDYRATILEACGIQVPAGLNGRSFLPLLSGQGSYQPHERVFIERNFHGEASDRAGFQFMDKWDPQRAVRTRDLHYVRNDRPGARKRQLLAREMTGVEWDAQRCWLNVQPQPDQERPREELYDLRHDPWELDNLAGRHDYRQIKQALADALSAWMTETDDPALKPGMPPPLCEPRWPCRDSPVFEVYRA